MYPIKDMFSRTTGIRKYLLVEFNKKKLSNSGLKTMLKAFFNNYSKYMDQLNTLFQNFDSKIIMQ